VTNQSLVFSFFRFIPYYTISLTTRSRVDTVVCSRFTDLPDTLATITSGVLLRHHTRWLHHSFLGLFWCSEKHSRDLAILRRFFRSSTFLGRSMAQPRQPVKKGYGQPVVDRYRPHGDRTQPWRGQAWGLASAQVCASYPEKILQS